MYNLVSSTQIVCFYLQINRLKLILDCKAEIWNIYILSCVSRFLYIYLYSSISLFINWKKVSQENKYLKKSWFLLPTMKIEYEKSAVHYIHWCIFHYTYCRSGYYHLYLYISMCILNAFQNYRYLIQKCKLKCW